MPNPLPLDYHMKNNNQKYMMFDFVKKFDDFLISPAKALAEHFRTPGGQFLLSTRNISCAHNM